MFQFEIQTFLDGNIHIGQIQIIRNGFAGPGHVFHNRFQILMLVLPHVDNRLFDQVVQNPRETAGLLLPQTIVKHRGKRDPVQIAHVFEPVLRLYYIRNRHHIHVGQSRFRRPRYPREYPVHDGSDLVHDRVRNEFDEFGRRQIMFFNFVCVDRFFVAVVKQRLGHALEFDEIRGNHVVVRHFQEFQGSVARILVEFEQIEAFHGAGTSHIQGVGTDLGVLPVRHVKKIVVVKPHHKHEFALTPLNTVESGEHDFALDDPLVQLVLFNGRNVARNPAFTQRVLHFTDVAVEAFDRSREDEDVAGQMALFQQLLDDIHHHFLNIVTGISDVGDGFSFPRRQHAFLSQHGAVDEIGHGCGNAVRRLKRTRHHLPLEFPGFCFGGRPNPGGVGQKPGVGALELIQTLLVIPENHELSGGIFSQVLQK